MVPTAAATTLAELVRRPSVNPMGRDLTGPDYLEARVSDYLAQRLAAAGIRWARQPVDPGRDNIVARVEATTPGAPVVLWDAHQDTVPADGMSIDPFAPVVRDGRLYGRGACDVKGGLAAMLVALETLARSASPRSATVVFVATVNEECGFTGARAAAGLWNGPRAPHDTAAHGLLSAAPALAVVAEPTELDFVAQHKGAVRWRVRVRGRACHSAYPECGDNAIYRAAPVVAALEALSGELLARHADHPCGPPTLSLGTIRGGTGVNLVPDLVVLEIDRRLLPGESPAAARDEVIARLAAASGGARVDHDPPFIESHGLPDGTAAPAAALWVERLAAAARRRGFAAAKTAARYGTNASIYAAAGVPSVVWGPGSIAQAHTADEWIDLVQLDAAVAALVDMVTGG
jgi:acetylornithine deacetylase/succinyl-diaminopimelate desuccinylase-like protein